MSGWHRAARVPAGGKPTRTPGRRRSVTQERERKAVRRVAGILEGDLDCQFREQPLPVAAAARALYCPTARLSDLFGMDRPLGQDDWVDERDAATSHAVKPSLG